MDRENWMSDMEIAITTLQSGAEWVERIRQISDEENSRHIAAFIDAIQYAIALLKAQEPRVMTLEEVKALPSETDVWLDEFCSIIVAATISCTLYGNAYFYGKEHADYGVDYKLIDYGKEWRCWTSRPTEEQREAEPWTT